MTTTDVLVVGAGHAGLAAAYHLSRRGLSVTVAERRGRVGDVWRERYDSLRLFTPRQVSALPGMPMGRELDTFPTRDQVADYQERYAGWLGVPVRLGTQVLATSVSDGAIESTTTDGRIRSSHVIAATGLFATPRSPPFARDLDASVTQVHASAYRRPSDIPDGVTVVVGSGNSGGDIAIELSATRDVILAEGTSRAAPPPWWRSVWAWRIARWRDRVTGGRGRPGGFGWPLRPGMFHAADLRRYERIRRVARAVAAEGNELILDDRRRVRADVVIWATGYDPALDWIRAPGDPRVHILSGRFLIGLPYRADALARRIARLRVT